MLRRRTRWFRRLATGLAFATLAAPAAAKVDDGGNAAATSKVIPYLSHGMTTSTEAQALAHYEALTHRQLEELAASRAIGNGDALTHRQMEELAASRAIGNGDALTDRLLEELAATQATQFIPGVTDFPKPVAIDAPRVINYLSHGATGSDFPGSADRIVSASVLGELVKSARPEAVVRPDDQADRFALSSVDSTVSTASTDSGLSWDGAMMIGIGTLVVVLALGLGFGYARRPRVAGL
jgi:hypothetical protein